MFKNNAINYEIRIHAGSGRIFSLCLSCGFEYLTRYTIKKLPKNRNVCPLCNSRKTTLGRFLFNKCTQAEWKGVRPELTEEAKAWIATVKKEVFA